jgi:hypothetical protein
MRFAIALLILPACADKEGMGSVSGSVSVPVRELSADVHWDSAFAYAEGDRLVAFLTGAVGASCSSVAEYLGPNDGALPKESILPGGSCAMTVVVDDWDGDLDLSWSEGDSPSYDNPGLNSNMQCWFGEGAWVLETRGSGYEDYYWTGPVWSGVPEIFDWSISGDDKDVSLDLEMSAFGGNFLHEASVEPSTAQGDLSGTIRAKWCSALSKATAL